MKRSSTSKLILLSAAVIASTTTCATGFWFSSGSDNEQSDTKKVQKEPDEPVEYGVDVSFPIHYATVSDNYPWLEHNMKPGKVPTPEKYKDKVIQPLGDRQKFYQHFLESCKDAFGNKGQRCVSNELDRIAMNYRQPGSMQNYTDIGFKKIKAPEKIFRLIKDFWDRNKDNSQVENWGIGNTYTNNWEVASRMVSVEDQSLRGGGRGLKQQIWNMAREVIEEWTGEELTECSLYGIRIYQEGAILASHVDRLPLVSSAIINVAQDLDEPWPLEVYGHDGRATNVTMQPGDMVLYESHSVVHGRPFPLKGRFMANIFIHFEPTGHSKRHHAKMEESKDDVHAKYRDSLTRGVSGHENEQNGLPSYIIPGSAEEDHWRMQHPRGQRSTRNSAATGSTVAHMAAQDGDLETLKREVSGKKHLVNAKDRNGWTPLHEGARAGKLDVVKYLVENGADVNMITGGDGGSALWWAKQQHGEDHPVVDFLISVGALEVGPDL